MPMYEYECLSCQERFEIIQKFSDQPATECPSCKGKVRKLLSAPAIQFKGSGWYVNDYGKSGKEAKKNGDADSKSESKSETKSESKSETKSESKDSKKESGSKGESSSKQTAKAGKE